MNHLLNAPFGDKKLVLVPYWIEEAMAEQNLPMGSVFDFTTLSQHFHEKELALWLALQSFAGVNCIEGYKSDALLKNWECAATGAQKTVLDTVVAPLSENELAVTQAFERLAAVADVHDTVMKSLHPWKIVDINRGHMLVYVQPGFAQALQDKSVRFSFVKEIVEILCEYADRHVVAQFPVFKDYMALIAERVRFA